MVALTGAVSVLRTHARGVASGTAFAAAPARAVTGRPLAAGGIAA